MATVKIKYRDKEYEVNAGMTVRDAIRKVGLQPEAVLAVSAGKLITDDTILEPDMQIKLVAVVSGGGARLPEEGPNPAGNASTWRVATGDAARPPEEGVNTAEGSVSRTPPGGAQ